MTQQDPNGFSRSTACIVIVLMALAVMPAVPMGAAALQTPDSHVASLTASPAFVNLHRPTTVTLTLASSYGGGADNYEVIVHAPDGTILRTAWMNFTSVGSQSLTLGSAANGLKDNLTQVGAYVVEVDHAVGAALNFASSVTVQTTNKLLVTTEFATASNPYTDQHICPLAEEFQRGDEIIARGYVRYLSTGELLNGTLVPTAAAPGKVTGTLFGLTQDIKYNKIGFWRAAWFISWNQSLGTFVYTVDASDGLGNSGTGVSPGPGVLGALRIIPSTLKTTLVTTNATSGAPSTAFFPGETVGIVARSSYALHFDHNFAYTNTNRTTAGTVAKPGPGQYLALGPDRGGVVTAAIGSGAFNVTSGKFANSLGTVALTYDAKSGNWTGTWPVPASVALGSFSVRAIATDGAPTANSGTFTSSITTLAKPLPVVVTKIQYVNKTVEAPAKTPGLALPIVLGGVAAVALALQNVNVVRSRRGRGGR